MVIRTPVVMAQENPCMSEAQDQLEGIRGFLWLSVGFLLLAAAIGEAQSTSLLTFSNTREPHGKEELTGRISELEK
jgi:hypothetical protein